MDMDKKLEKFLNEFELNLHSLSAASQIIQDTKRVPERPVAVVSMPLIHEREIIDLTLPLASPPQVRSRGRIRRIEIDRTPEPAIPHPCTRISTSPVPTSNPARGTVYVRKQSHQERVKEMNATNDNVNDTTKRPHVIVGAPRHSMTFYKRGRLR